MGFRPEGKSKKWKKGDIALISWEHLYGPDMRGKGLARCEVQAQRRVRSPITKQWRNQLQVRDPKGKLWFTVDWHRKGAKPVR